MDLPCVYRGQEIGSADCGCGLGVVPFYACDSAKVASDRCVLRSNDPVKTRHKGFSICARCEYREWNEKDPGKPRRELPGDKYRPWKKGYEPPLSISVMPARTMRIETRLPNEFQFNCSICEHDGKRLLAFRVDWKGSRIGIGELQPDWRLSNIRFLNLPRTDRNTYGCEDPRLFVHEGLLHVAYTGAIKERGRFLGAMHLVTLDSRWRVIQHFEPEIDAKQPTEKNWAWFSHRGILHAVYWCAPKHRVYRLEGRTMQPVSDPAWDGKYTGGEIRGGGSPVLHNGEYYHWFHGLTQRNGRRLYSVGLYTFEAREPFAPKRIISQPLLLPNASESPHGHHPLVVFPCGAIHDYERGEWIVSYGYFDKWCYAATWSESEIERALTPVS